MQNILKAIINIFSKQAKIATPMNNGIAIKSAGALITAIAVPAMVFLGMTSDIGITKTAQFEGTVLDNYYDSVGVKTWCTGETQVGYKADGSYDDAYCKALFFQSYNKYNGQLYSCYNDTALSDLTVPMHVAFVDMYYNTGRKCNTGMIRNMNAGKPKEACNFILKYKYAGGQDCSLKSNRTCRGVWSRRLEMHKLCLSGINK